MDSIRFASVNARGLKNRLKRNAFFHYLKSQKFDIVCLQESHISGKDVPVWEKQWGGKVFFNEGTDHSRGKLF